MIQVFGMVVAATLVCTAGSAVAVERPGPAALAHDEAGLERAERTWADALQTGDVDALAGLIDDEFTFIGPDGEAEGRDAYLAGYRALPSQGVAVLGIDFDDVHMRFLGEVGVVTGRVVARVKVPSGTVVENVRFTRVYRRDGSRWRMVAGQGTRVATSAP